jgi:hypothetical protein
VTWAVEAADACLAALEIWSFTWSSPSNGRKKAPAVLARGFVGEVMHLELTSRILGVKLQFFKK